MVDQFPLRDELRSIKSNFSMIIMQKQDTHGIYVKGQMFVHTDTLPPAIALWLPNIVFAIIAGFLYRIAPK